MMNRFYNFYGSNSRNISNICIIAYSKKLNGLIPLLKPLLDDLVNNLKFRLSSKIYLLALQKEGE